MIGLIDVVENMMNELQGEIEVSTKRCDAEHMFIEMITFLNRDDLLEILDIIESQYWTEFPIWGRNLVYRLVDLQKPQEPEFKRRMSASLRSFGPDWDHIADRLELEARSLDKDN